jgi:ABC-type transport system involved in multi-copper enzyme maturation permease subunit
MTDSNNLIPWITVISLGLVGFLVLALVVYLAYGLFQARSLIRRELTGYFFSPIAYAVFVVFLAVTGHLFYVTLDLLTTTGPKGTEWPMRSMFADERFWLVFLFIPPLLTMRLFAEERSSGTLEMLLTAPLRDWQVVLGKYVACLLFFVLLCLPTLVYLPALLGATHPSWDFHAWTLNSITMVSGIGGILLGLVLLWPSLGTFWRILSVILIVGGGVAAGLGGYAHYHDDVVRLVEIPISVDPMPVLSTYLALFLAGAMFLALGLFVSSLVRDQLVAALIAMALSLLFIVAGFVRPDPDGGAVYQTAYFFSVPLHFDRIFTRGMIDTRPLVLYTSVAVFSLFLTVRSLESRRWR